LGETLRIVSTTIAPENEFLIQTQSAATLTSAPMQTKTLVTPLPSATQPQEPAQEVVQDCVNILPTNLKDQEYNGELIFKKHPQDGSGFTHYDLASREKKDIPGSNITLTVSPDRKHYTYISVLKKTLIVYTANGDLVREVPIQENWSSVAGWINNNHLQINIQPSSDANSSDFEWHPSLIINPFTDESRLLVPDYPNPDHGNYFNWEGYGKIMYDPSLTRVVYPGYGKKDAGILLWDIPNHKILAEVPYGLIPRWLPDGSKFVLFSLSDEFFYLVTRDGAITKLRQVSNVAEYNWSPDGQHIAITLFSRQSERRLLIILDTLSGEIINFCLPEDYGNDMTIPPVPVWSPDGKAVVMEVTHREKDKNTVVILIDLKKNIAVLLENNLLPIGWLINAEN